MDGSRFDAIARRLGGGAASRRSVIAGAAALAGAALLGREASAVPTASCRGYKERCVLHKQSSCVLLCKVLNEHDKKARKECISECPDSCEVDCCSGFWTVKKKRRHKRATCGCQADGASCGFDYHCCSGVCDGNVCASSAGTCPADARHTCETFVTCGTDQFGDCSCIKTLEGNTACGSNAAHATPKPCSSTAQCVGLYGPGVVCQAPDSGCAGQVCVVPCDGEALSATKTRSADKAGLVPNHRAR